MVQYDRGDHLFTLGGMEAAHGRIAAHYAQAGTPGAHDGRSYDGAHKFDAAMQMEASAWPRDVHAPPSPGASAGFSGGPPAWGWRVTRNV